MASVVAGVTGDVGVRSASSCEEADACASCGTVSSAQGLGVFLSTLSGLNGKSPLAAHPATIFHLLNTLSSTGL